MAEPNTIYGFAIIILFGHSKEKLKEDMDRNHKFCFLS